jgi:hypothetical protein
MTMITNSSSVPPLDPISDIQNRHKALVKFMAVLDVAGRIEGFFASKLA